MLSVDRLQSRLRDMGVYLGRRQTAMSQQHLHGAQIGTVIQQMRGEGMPQRMRRKNRFHTGRQQVLLDVLPECLARNRSTAARQKKRIVNGTCHLQCGARLLQTF